MNKNLNVLLVDDEPDVIFLLKRIISTEKGYNVITATNGKSALETIKNHHIDILLTDLRMPEMDGMELISKVNIAYPDITIVVITADAQIQTAVEAVRGGAYDFLTKPFDKDIIRITLGKVAERHALRKQNILLQEMLSHTGELGFVGTSEPMQNLYRMIERVAPTESNILITGESGTGKELVARAIHKLSRRKSHKFVAVNCTALPESILESELFGHLKGSFTGAIATRKGLFEEANHATIFLDEIGDISANMQSKLLRVLQNGEVKRIGDTKTMTVDTRVISATNQDLKSKIANKSFREDLYFRLNVIPILVPPLRDRKEDIPMLAHHFLKIFSQKNNNETNTISADAMSMLVSKNWSGNIRELENAIERAVILCRDNTLKVEDFGFNEGKASVERQISGTRNPDHLLIKSYKDAKRMAQDNFNQEYLSHALALQNGNVSKAAKAIGIERQSLQKIMRKCGIKSEDFRNKKK